MQTRSLVRGWAQDVKAAGAARGRERNGIVRRRRSPQYGNFSFVPSGQGRECRTSSRAWDNGTMTCLAVSTSAPEWGHRTAIRKTAAFGGSGPQNRFPKVF